MIAGFRDFEFPLADALLRELVSVLDAMESGPLTVAHLADIPEAQGVYQLSKDGVLVYVGKTDSDAGLKKRLRRHAETIQYRHNLDVTKVTFKAVRVLVFTAMDLETLLIRYYEAQAPITWNKSGFGSNDPGRQREHTELKPEGFDAAYPLDIDREILLGLNGNVTVAQLFQRLKAELPYIFRFEGLGPRSRRPHADLAAAHIVLPAHAQTTRAYLTVAMAALPHGWQATAFPGRVIAYKETFDYEFGSIVSRSE